MRRGSLVVPSSRCCVAAEPAAERAAWIEVKFRPPAPRTVRKKEFCALLGASSVMENMRIVELHGMNENELVQFASHRVV